MRHRARGPRPRFFAEAELDQFHVMLVALLGEVSVLRDRLDAVERLLDGGRPFTRTDLDAYVPQGDAITEREAQRTALVERVLRVVIDDAAGTGDTGYATVEDVVAAVSAPSSDTTTPGRSHP